MKARISGIFLGALAGLCVSTTVHAVSIQDFSSVGGSGSTAYNAEADFTVGNGTLTLVLKNLQADPISAAELISGISFTFGTSFTSPSLTSSSGNVANIAADGTYTAPGSATSPLPRWHISGSSSTSVSLTALGGGQPSDLIIGADSKGGFSGAGVYDKQNTSIGNFQPSVLGSATFVFALNGITENSKITSVTFAYGTGPDTTGAGTLIRVPDGGSTMALLGTGLVGLGLLRRKLSK